MPVHALFPIQPAHHEDLSCGCWERQLNRLGGMAAAQARIAKYKRGREAKKSKLDTPFFFDLQKVDKKNRKKLFAYQILRAFD